MDPLNHYDEQELLREQDLFSDGDAPPPEDDAPAPRTDDDGDAPPPTDAPAEENAQGAEAEDDAGGVWPAKHVTPAMKARAEAKAKAEAAAEEAKAFFESLGPENLREPKRLVWCPGHMSSVRRPRTCARDENRTPQTL